MKTPKELEVMRNPWAPAELFEATEARILKALRLLEEFEEGLAAEHV